MLARSNAILLVAAVLTGLAIGFAGSTMAYRYKLLRVPGQSLIERMDETLKLNPSQREQIRQVMEETRAQALNIRLNFQHQRHRLMIGAYLKVRALLKPDQQARFDDEFIPPKFRAEARHLQVQRSAAAGESLPSPRPTP